ncbi:MAG TPA: sulfatase-like hydrolase/transferase [Thermoanaerobaculia bacterium]|nr:sulfatase-like hydrolase/transferase [Thermoanaerobaculia bacterium]
MLVAAGLGAIVLCTVSCGADEAAARRAGREGGRLNVVLLVSDTLRRDVLGFAGGEAVTPNIDRLAANGVVFQSAYSTGPSTVPSSVGMLTGRYHHAYPLTETTKGDDPYEAFLVADSEVLLAEILAESGYTVLKSVENPNAEVSNNLQGFADLPEYDELSPARRSRILEELRVPSTDRAFREMFGTLDYLLTVGPDEPFFLLKWILDPHEPFDPPDGFPPRGNEHLRLPRDPEAYRGWHTRQLDQYWGELSENERRALWNLYLAEVESVDARVGLVIEALRRSNLLEKTIVVFTSDHGEMFGEHGFRGHKRRFYEELVHVPLVLMGPGLPAKAVVRESFSHVSLMPTLAELLDVRLPGDVQGHSYVPSMLARSPSAPSYLYLAPRSLNASGAVVAGSRKLHVYGTHGERVHVFDVEVDPSETRDLGEGEASFDELNRYFLTARAENESRRRRREREISGVPERPPLADETVQRLRALGYLE